MADSHDNDTDGVRRETFEGWLLKILVVDILAIGNIICKKNISLS